MKAGKVVFGVLAGVAVGALIGIVFAPGKGSKTRKDIVGKGEDYLEDLKEKFNSFLASASEKYDGAKHETEELIGRGKARYEEVKKELKSNNA